jgi:hypothetical protein
LQEKREVRETYSGEQESLKLLQVPRPAHPIPLQLVIFVQKNLADKRTRSEDNDQDDQINPRKRCKNTRSGKGKKRGKGKEKEQDEEEGEEQGKGKEKVQDEEEGEEQGDGLNGKNYCFLHKPVNNSSSSSLLNVEELALHGVFLAFFFHLRFAW